MFNWPKFQRIDCLNSLGWIYGYPFCHITGSPVSEAGRPRAPLFLVRTISASPCFHHSYWWVISNSLYHHLSAIAREAAPQFHWTVPFDLPVPYIISRVSWEEEGLFFFFLPQPLQYFSIPKCGLGILPSDSECAAADQPARPLICLLLLRMGGEGTPPTICC